MTSTMRTRTLGELLVHLRTDEGYRRAVTMAVLSGVTTDPVHVEIASNFRAEPQNHNSTALLFLTLIRESMRELERAPVKSGEAAMKIRKEIAEYRELESQELERRGEFAHAAGFTHDEERSKALLELAVLVRGIDPATLRQ